MKTKHEILEYHLDQLRHPPFNGSIVHFLEGGNINGNFLTKLEMALDDWADQQNTGVHLSVIKARIERNEAIIERDQFAIKFGIWLIGRPITMEDLYPFKDHLEKEGSSKT